MKSSQACSRPNQLPADWHEALHERGFATSEHGYARGELTVAREDEWYVLRELAGASEQSLRSSVGEPGLWKWAQNGLPPHRVFEVPAWVVRAADETDRGDEAGSVSAARILDWALETRAGRLPAAWKPPQREVVQAWLLQGGLTVRADGEVRQAEVILESNRWALRCAVLSRVPDDLPCARREALEELVLHAQSRWSLARFGFLQETLDHPLVAEVDLSGAPPCELLFSAGLEALKHAVGWLAETAEVLADPRVVIRSLTAATTQTQQNERNNT